MVNWSHAKLARIGYSRKRFTRDGHPDKKIPRFITSEFFYLYLLYRTSVIARMFLYLSEAISASILRLLRRQKARSAARNDENSGLYGREFTPIRCCCYLCCCCSPHHCSYCCWYLWQAMTISSIGRTRTMNLVKPPRQ